MDNLFNWITAKALGLLLMAVSAAYIGFLVALFWRCFLLGWEVLQ